MLAPSGYLETADIETSSEDYAGRFSGPVGAWFLQIQEDATLRMLAPYAGATVLDVGGGHGQITEPLLRRGYKVTVLGSSEVCKARIARFVDAGRCAFRVGDILSLPYPDRHFDVAISYRLLPHALRWPQVLKELTRVAEKAVLIDYPALRSFNWLSGCFFALKKNIEGNTRPFTCFDEADLLRAVAGSGFVRGERYAEFFLPMALHRLMNRPALSSAAEQLFRMSGITSRLGSPVLLKLVREGSAGG